MEVMDSKIKTNEDFLMEYANGDGFFKDKRKDVYLVNPAFVVPQENFNVRDYSREDVIEHIAELKASIRVRGVITPLKAIREKIGVNDNGDNIYIYKLVDGECRLRACKELIDEGENIARIPVLCAPQGYNAADAVIDMLTANKSHKFSPIELGRAYKRMLNFGYDIKEIAFAMGRVIKVKGGKDIPNVTHVQECLALLDFNKEIQDELKSGIVKANHIKTLDKSLKGKVGNKTKRKEMVEEQLSAIIEKSKVSNEYQPTPQIRELVKEQATQNEQPAKLEKSVKSEAFILGEKLEYVLDFLPSQPLYSRVELLLLVMELKNNTNNTIEDVISSVFQAPSVAVG